MPPETGAPCTGMDFLELIAGTGVLPDGYGPVLIVAAHPDDEVVGAGGRFPRLRDSVRFLHVTDGAPRNLLDARAAGCSTRGEYARTRRGELFEALARVKIGPECCFFLDVPDQETPFHLVRVTREIMEILARIRPCLVLAPPYEGGHPDHDAVAFAVHAALNLRARTGGSPVPLLEYAMYHSDGEGWMFFEFLPMGESTEWTVLLTDEEREVKAEMMGCFRSQRRVLETFPVGIERFRSAPEYDFTLPPHPGMLLYERYDWGISGERWRERAGQALDELGMGGHR